MIIHSYAMEEIKSSGIYSKIKNKHLKNLVNDYYSDLYWVFGDDKQSSAIAQLSTYLRENYNLLISDLILLDYPIKLIEKEFLQNKKNSICLGARTGQEVFVLRELGLDSIGIDLAEFPPYTIKGDIHNLFYEDGIFDLVFTNILDHSLYLQKFISEMERVSTKGGIIILNIQENMTFDDYSENIINDSKPIIELFKNSSLLKSRKIKNTFDGMNRELIFEKN